MHYYNSKGDAGKMVSTITENEFKIEGDGLMFSGIINDENTLITGKWIMKTENDKWIDFIDLLLRKLTS